MAMSAEVMAALIECDHEIADAARDLAQRWLEMGYSIDDLPVLLKPWLHQVALLRARHLARLEHVDRAQYRIKTVH